MACEKQQSGNIRGGLAPVLRRCMTVEKEHRQEFSLDKGQGE